MLSGNSTRDSLLGGTSPSGSGSQSSSPINYGMVIGIVFGVFGAILVVLAIGFVVLLVFMKARSKGRSVRIC